MQLALWTAEKRCKACGLVKARDDFQREPRNHDGLWGTCRSCVNLRNRGRRGPRTPEQLQVHRERETARRRANPEHIREIKRAEYERNRERYAERVKRWRVENAERHRANSAADARRRRLDRDVDAVTYADILRRDPCSYCDESATEVDHIVAVTAGGDNGWLNLTAACRLCNGRKSDRPLLQFLLRLSAQRAA